MTGVLVDTSSFLDLILDFPGASELSWRKRPPAIAETVEALIIHDSILVDGPSFNGFLEGTRRTRYVRRHPRFSGKAMEERFEDLRQITETIDLSESEIRDVYSEAIDELDRSLVKDDDNSRGQGLYYGLPSHLTMDNTDIECSVDGPPSSDLRDVMVDLSPELRQEFARLIEVLDHKGHPTRASVALPLIRLIYYQILQKRSSVHFVPHVTKAILLGNRPSESGVAESIVDYFDRNVRKRFEERKRDVFGGSSVSLPVPLVAAYVLNDVRGWDHLLDRIIEVRESKNALRFRRAVSQLTEFLEERKNTEVDEVLGDLKAAADAWQENLSIKHGRRKVTVTLPVVGLSTKVDIPDLDFRASISRNLLVFIHELLTAA